MNSEKFQDNQQQDTNYFKDVIVLGEIVSVFGVKGYIKLNSFTDPKESIVQYFKLGVDFLWSSKKSVEGFELSDKWSNMPLEDMKAHGSSKIVAKLLNCDDRDLAEKFRGVQIAIKRDDLSKFDLEEGEFYWHDLEGLEVFDESGHFFGLVSHVLATGANDVLVVKNTDNKDKKTQEHLIPFVYNHYILKVDYDNKRIIVDWDFDF